MGNISVNRFHFIMGVSHGIFSLLALGDRSNCRDIFYFGLILIFLGLIKLWISLSRCLGAFYVFWVENSLKMSFFAKNRGFFFDDSSHLISFFFRKKKKNETDNRSPTALRNKSCPRHTG